MICSAAKLPQQRGATIDLLPDRESGTVAAWLRQHLGSEIVSRDRGGIYAQATRVVAPNAVRVADRWHLLRNLSEALKNALSPHHRLLTQAVRGGMGEASEVATAPVSTVPPWELRAQQKNRARRYSRYDEVRRLGKTGASHAFIARQLDLDHRTVRKFLQATTILAKRDTQSSRSAHRQHAQRRFHAS